MKLLFPPEDFTLQDAYNYMKMLEDHFNYIIKDINSYDGLTEEEKSIIPRELFENFTMIELPTNSNVTYIGKYIYIDADNKVRSLMNDRLVECSTEEKQPLIIPGVYDGLWSAYYLEIIFKNGNKSESIKTIEGVRGMNCEVKVIVTNDGSVYID